ncbi:hypothetical protein PMI42_01712 [Bradyrhizobium sp. YR681]|nr:hypothetical protein [Bradyrhizobium sp. YR681]EJN14738.1 hypothetical protein PMI42_01712 [Bradyrhizobium sp. YR681]
MMYRPHDAWIVVARRHWSLLALVTISVLAVVWLYAMMDSTCR